MKVVFDILKGSPNWVPVFLVLIVVSLRRRLCTCNGMWEGRQDECEGKW